MATYSFMNVTASIVGPGGSFSLGYGSNNAEEGISIDPAGDKNTMTIGADGGGMHSLHADRSGTVTIRLLKTSPVNQQLMALYKSQTTNPANHGQNTITVRDIRRGDVAVCQECAFKRLPANQWSKVGNTIEWTFDVVTIDETLG
jgi:hypothetical protein